MECSLSLLWILWACRKACSCVWLYPSPERCDPGKTWWVANGTSSTWPKTYYSDQLEAGRASDRQRTTTVSLKHCYQKCVVSKSFVSLIWICIYTQLQTNMWGTIQGFDSMTQNYVAFTWISSWSKSISGAELQVRIWTVLFYCFTLNVLCREVKKGTMIEIKEHG